MSMPPPEVIIVGAGPAGCALACRLARADVSTLLLDKASFPRDKVCGDCLSPRAQHHLARLGLLDDIAAEAHAVSRIGFQAPSGARASADIARALRADAADPRSMPGRALVLPRRRFDERLWRHALAAGAQFRVGHVRQLLRSGEPGTADSRLVGAGAGVFAGVVNDSVDSSTNGTVCGVLLNGEPVPARLVVVATGAATGLLRRSPLYPARSVPNPVHRPMNREAHGPLHSVAARCYLSGVAMPDAGLRFFFDHLPLPGYAWVFPTGPRSANIGFWYNGKQRQSAAALLTQLLARHPVLSALARDAETVGPVAGFPIRTDFLTAPKVAPGLLAIGEAAGLVNPFTGEGIDYALESAELAAETVLEAFGRLDRQRDWPHQGPLTAGALASYPRALNRRFRSLFLVMATAHRYGFNPWVFNRLFGGGERGQPLVDTLVRVCFGAAPPLSLLHPIPIARLLWSRAER
ncbi:lycopene cyclase family protein [Thiohalocapsa marina]|nr:lycopene cyclase family protein [Thiohalocapsa marina]